MFYKRGRGVWALRHPGETLRSKSDNDLFVAAIAGMTKEELESYSGNGLRLISHVERLVAGLKAKYGVGTAGRV